MAAIHWLNPISGSFTNVSDWSGFVVPGPSDDAILDAVGGSPYTVTSSTSVSVNSIQTAPDATLSITAGVFTTASGTGSGANGGIILVADGATFSTADQITNSGSIRIAGAHHRGGVLYLNHSATLVGGGQVYLQGTGAVSANDKKHSVGLTNVDNTIFGSGLIGGSNNFDLINGAAGVVDATAAGGLVIRADVQNNGLMEATGVGGLTLSGAYTQSGGDGIFLAADGSVVRFAGTRVEYGALESEGSGVLAAYSSYFKDVINRGNLTIENSDTLASGIDNVGTISVDASCLIGGELSLTGGGVVNLAMSGSLFADKSGMKLANVDNTIAGSGVISGLTLTIVNESQGIIAGNGSYEFRLGGATVVNAGTIESSGAYGLAVSAPLDNSGLLVASAGTLAIGRLGANYALTNTGTINATGGVIVANVDVSGAGAASISAGTLDFAAAFNEAVSFTGASGALKLARSQDFSKAITGFSGSGGTSLDLEDVGFVGSGEATFSGTKKRGVLTVTDGVHTATIKLNGDYREETFVASSDGHGGTLVVTERTKEIAVPPHGFISAMAAFGPPVSALIHKAEPMATREYALANPRVASA